MFSVLKPSLCFQGILYEVRPLDVAVVSEELHVLLVEFHLEMMLQCLLASQSQRHQAKQPDKICIFRPSSPH